MNKTWKWLVPVMFSSGLIACSTTGQTPVEPEKNVQAEAPKVEHSKTEDKQITPKQPVLELKAQKTSDGKLILGEKEWVYVPSLEQNFKARIDTGATTSSISAIDIESFERDGKDWVKFKIEHDNVKSKEISLPVERWVKIRQSSADGTQRRAVVEVWIQIGDLKEKTEFTLADRTHLTFPLLLGRSFFKDIAVVDVSQQYIQDKQ